SFVYQCASAVAKHVRGHTVIVLKSTVPLGTAEEIEAIIGSERAAGSWSVASNPEFLREGAAIADSLRPDRVVIGSENERSRNVLARLYRPLRQQGVPIVFTNRRTAELSKYAANGFLATKSPTWARSRTYARRQAPISDRSPSAWGSTGASANSSCIQVPAMAARA